MVRSDEAAEAGVPAGLAVATPGGWRDMRMLQPGALIWAASGAVRLLGLRRRRGLRPLGLRALHWRAGGG